MALTDYSQILVSVQGKFMGKREVETTHGTWLLVSLYAEKVKEQSGSHDALCPSKEPGYQPLSKAECETISKRFFCPDIPANVYCAPGLQQVYALEQGGSFKAVLIGVNGKYAPEELWMSEKRMDEFQWHLAQFR